MKPFVIALVAALGCSTALAQSQYPTKPIRIVVSVSAGGAPDLAARTVGTRLTKSLGQPVIVENRAGANGNLAGQYVAQAAPDGYTLLLAPDAVVVVNKLIYKKLSYDPTKDLTPVAAIIRNQFVLVVHPSVPANNLKEFVEYARKAPKPLAYASAGNGSQHHLLMEMLKARAGIEMLHVPFKGGVPAVASTLAGDTQATITGGPSSSPHVRAGKLRLIAGTAQKRWEPSPDVPVIAETYPGYEGTVWSGLFATGGTPAPIVGRLHAAVNAVLAEDEVRDIFVKSGGSLPYIISQEELAQLIRSDTEKFEKVVSAIKLTAD